MYKSIKSIQKETLSQLLKHYNSAILHISNLAKGLVIQEFMMKYAKSVVWRSPKTASCHARRKLEKKFA